MYLLKSSSRENLLSHPPCAPEGEKKECFYSLALLLTAQFHYIHFLSSFSNCPVHISPARVKLKILWRDDRKNVRKWNGGLAKMAASLLPVSRPRGSTLSTGFQFYRPRGSTVQTFNSQALWQYRLSHLIGPAVAVRYFSSGELVTDGDFNS